MLTTSALVHEACAYITRNVVSAYTMLMHGASRVVCSRYMVSVTVDELGVSPNNTAHRAHLRLSQAKQHGESSKAERPARREVPPEKPNLCD